MSIVTNFSILFKTFQSFTLCKGVKTREEGLFQQVHVLVGPWYDCVCLHDCVGGYAHVCTQTHTHWTAYACEFIHTVQCIYACMSQLTESTTHKPCTSLHSIQSYVCVHQLQAVLGRLQLKIEAFNIYTYTKFSFGKFNLLN